MLKSLIILAAITFSVLSYSQNSIVDVEGKDVPWSFEGSAIAQTLENSNSPFVGATAIYNKTDRVEFGLRAMTSLSGKKYERGHSLQTIQRYRFYKNKTDLFIEFNQGYAVDYYEEYSLFGSSIGLTHSLNKEMSFGGFAGIDKIFGYRGISPKISTFVSVSL